VLADDEVSELNRLRDRPSRNFTADQWRDIAAKLPSGAAPRRETWFAFLLASNVYWEVDAGPSPREKARLMEEAVDEIRSAMDKIYIAAPRLRDDVLHIGGQFLTRFIYHRDTLQDLAARAPTFADPRFHRREFLAAAADLWLACGGKLGFSRSTATGEPSGPLIRYLTFVCKLVMDEDAPALETLAAFVREYQGKRRRKKP
jgi:hypothetical protein